MAVENVNSIAAAGTYQAMSTPAATPVKDVVSVDAKPIEEMNSVIKEPVEIKKVDAYGKDGNTQNSEQQENQPSEWSKGYGEEIIPYAASHTVFPKERLTADVLDRLNRAVCSGILSRTRFVKNQYGCFILGTKKASLY